MIKKILTSLVLVLPLGLFFLIARKKEVAQTPVILNIQWEPQAQFLGYYVAVEKGFFLEENLDVRIQSSMGKGLGGEMDEKIIEFEINHLVNVLKKITRIRNPVISNILHTGCNMGLVGKRPIKDALNSKLVHYFTWWGGNDPFIDLIKKNEVKVSRSFPSKIGPDDLVIVMKYNQLVDYKRKYPDNLYFETFCDLGYYLYEDVLLSKKSVPKKVEKSMKTAIEKGWKWVSENPVKSLDILMSYKPRRSRDFQKQQLEIYLESFNSNQISLQQLKSSVMKMRGNRDFYLSYSSLSLEK